MPTEHERLWIGEFVFSGLMFIYDPALQISNDSQVTIYSLHYEGARSHDRVKLREITRPVLDPERRENALTQYANWRQADGQNYVQRELVQREQIARREIEEKHKIFLKNRAKPFLGTRDRSNFLPPRATHCWACHGSLDSTVNLECVACGWILCTCGACGCGRSSERNIVDHDDEDIPF